ncbi:MAG: DUF6506 family protein [Anaerolineae bacterium]
MALKAAFVFLAPQVDPQQHRQRVCTPEVELTAVAVNNYSEAVQVCQQLVADGIAAIELCGGFGAIGAAQIAEAVQGQAAVGVVRFDGHPGLNNQSGDKFFNN